MLGIIKGKKFQRSSIWRRRGNCPLAFFACFLLSAYLSLALASRTAPLVVPIFIIVILYIYIYSFFSWGRLCRCVGLYGLIKTIRKIKAIAPLAAILANNLANADNAWHCAGTNGQAMHIRPLYKLLLCQLVASALLRRGFLSSVVARAWCCIICTWPPVSL